MSLLAELRRRNVIRVGAAYLVAAWLIVQVAATIAPAFEIGAWLVRTVVVVLATGFVPALILSWVFELTPVGLRRDEDVAGESDYRRHNTRTLDRLIIVTLTIAVAYFAIDKFVFDTDSDPEWRAAAERAKAFTETLSTDRATVAVLPFRSVSPDPEHAHFAVGLAEEILNALAAVKSLRVSSRTSAFAIGERDLPIGEIAEILGVDHVLEGSVRRAGDQVRVAATFVDARTDEQLWSRNFDRQLTVENVFEIQSQIASEVVNALNVTLVASANPDNKLRGPTDLRALDHYHDGLHFLNRLSPIEGEFDRDFERARESFEAAIAIDPGWAPPLAKLGALYQRGREAADDPDEALAIAERYASRALELDPRFGPAHESMAYLRTTEGDYAVALQQYDLAISLGSGQAHWGKAITLRVLGRHEESIAEFLAATAVDPLDEIGRFQLFETYYCAGRFRDAIDGLTRFAAFNVDAIYPRILLATVQAHLGERATALSLADAISRQINNETPLATVFALAGESERASRALASADANQPFITLDIAPAAVLLGDPDRALTMLEEAADRVLSGMGRSDRYGWLWRFRCSPVTRQLEGNPRYEQLLDRLGFPD